MQARVLTQSLEQYGGPFQIVGAFGRRIVLPPDLADWAKNDPRFSAKEVVEKTMASSLPGFEGLQAPNLLITMIRSNLSTNLSKFPPSILDNGHSM